MVNNRMNNEYTVKYHNEDHIEIRPKLKGGGEMNITCINVRGMVTEQTNKHKMKEM